MASLPLLPSGPGGVQRFLLHRARPLVRIHWRRGWDLNPRYSFPYTALPMPRLRPLGHLSCAEKKGTGYFFSLLCSTRALQCPSSQHEKVACPHFSVSMAERVGFEPTVQLPGQRFSRPPDSAALAPLPSHILTNSPLVLRPSPHGG